MERVAGASRLDSYTAPGVFLAVRAGLPCPDAGSWQAWLADGEDRLARLAGPRVGRGRDAAYRVRLGQIAGVWRRNRHGGGLGPLLGARYRSAARLQQEIALSEELRARGLLTPRVLLGLARRRGLFWSQHLVTEELEGALTVFEARAQEPALAAAAALLPRLFEAGLWARDLHPDNLLWQARTGECAVIDLAGARLLGRPLTAGERRARMRRFVRYFRKHGGAVPAPFR